MARIVVSEFVSIDGVMEAPGGNEGYKHDGWTFTFDRGDEGEKYKLREALASSGLLLGRTTYEGFAAAWPSIPGEFGDHFNAMTKYVVSSTLTDPSWNNTTVLTGDPVAAVTKLRETAEGDLLVNGSARLVHLLMEHDLVDEMHLMVFPVVLGTGKRVFGETTDLKRFKMTESMSVGEGVGIVHYQR